VCGAGRHRTDAAHEPIAANHGGYRVLTSVARLKTVSVKPDRRLRRLASPISIWRTAERGLEGDCASFAVGHRPAIDHRLEGHAVDCPQRGGSSDACRRAGYADPVHPLARQGSNVAQNATSATPITVKPTN
jgi:hypothetical protein